MIFQNRTDAGRRLAGKLRHLKDRRPVILALPRGGVPIGYEIARELEAPLDIVLVRKIGVPWQPELALGAVTDGAQPQTFINRELVTALAISDAYVKKETARQLGELERRRRLYCAGRPPLDITECTAIVVDDGIATGATIRVAVEATRRRSPAWLVIAAPVAAADTIATLQPEADELICVDVVAGLGAIGSYYDDFHQVSDAEVAAILARTARPPEGEAVAR